MQLPLRSTRQGRASVSAERMTSLSMKIADHAQTCGYAIALLRISADVDHPDGALGPGGQKKPAS